MKHYDYSNATKFRDLFSDEFLESLEIKNEQLTHVVFKRGKRVHLEFIRSVFTAYMKAIVQDCMDNNTKFIAPGRFWFTIYIAKISDSNLNRILKSGIYKNVDLLRSEFNIYQFMFYSPYLKKSDNKRRIRINYPKYNELIEKVNNGRRYGRHKERHYKYYFKKVREQFPGITHDQLDRIVREGCYQLQRTITCDEKDVLLKNSYHKFSMTIFRYVPISKRKKQYGNN